MMMLVNLVALMLLALLLAFLINCGRTVTYKAEHQHVADHVAYAATLQKARMMNAITAANHLMGESLGIVVVHHALGGDLLDAKKTAEHHLSDAKARARLNQLNRELDAAQEAASAVNARTPAYQRVRQVEGLPAQATLLAAKSNLKRYLCDIYWKKVAAKAMQAYPPTKPAGVQLELAMDAFEREVGAEYQVLDTLEKAAIDLLPLKSTLRDKVLVDAKRFTTDTVAIAPRVVQEAADEVGAIHGVECTYVVDPTLPVVIDPLARAQQVPLIPALTETNPNCCPCLSQKTDVTRDQIVKVTQLARATFPWVNYHRQPLWDALKALVPLSRAEHYFKEYSDGYCKRLCDRYQMDTEHDFGLFVLADYPAPDKGYELWSDDATADRRLVNRRLGTLVATYVPPGSVLGAPAVYQQHHADGQLAFAQGILYNANPQRRHARRIDLQCKRITPNHQAQAGYDTLNWVPGKQTDQMPWELIAKTDQGGPPTPEFPEIKLNWQAQLVPASTVQLQLLKQGTTLPETMRPVVDRILDHPQGALLAH
jgi:hypothetical protein